MKNLYLLPFLCFFLIPSVVEAQAPEGINYQAMYRNASGTAMPNKKIEVRININQGASNGPLVYKERHKTQTNGQGLFNVVLGNGLSIDDFSSIDWSFGPYFMHIEIYDVALSQNIYFGFQQLLSVPYALHAKVADSIAGGSSGSGEDGLSAYQIWLEQGNSGTEIDFLTSLEGEDGQDGEDGLQGQPGADGQDGQDGAPGQPGADGQDGADGQGGVTSAGTNVTITGSGVQSDPYVVNASDDQSLTGANLNGTTLDLSIEDGNGVSVNLAPLQDGVDDADNDPSNELNTGATFNNNVLEIQDAGGAVIADLSSLDNSGTDDQNISGSSLTGTTLKIGIENGASETVDLSSLQDGVDDADNDPTNELNTGATFTNNILEIQDAGGAVIADLSALDDSGTDDQNASEVFYDNTISELGGNEVQSAIDQLALDMTTNGVATIKQYTNSDFLSNCATLGSGTWQTIAVIPGISPQNSQVDIRASYAKFQLYDYSEISGGGSSKELLEFNVSRFWDDGQIQLLNHNVPSTNSASIKIEKIRLQYGKVSVGGGSVDCANIQIYRSHTCVNQNNAITNIFVKMTNQIPLSETPLVIIPMELTSTPLSLTNITTDEINILNNNGDDVNDADSNPQNEIQDLSLNNNILSLSQSNENIDLSGFLQEEFWTRNASSGSLYPVTLSDKVGINNSNPQYNLDVNGVLATTYLYPRFGGSEYRFLRFGSDVDYYGGLMWNNTSTSYGDGDDFSIFTYANRDIALVPNGSGLVRVHNSDMILNAGNLGVGTENPNARLTVNGGNIALRNSSNDFDAIKLYNSGVASLQSFYNEGNEIVKIGTNGSGSSGYINLNEGNSNTQNVSIRANGNSYLNGGNLGIGLTNPSVALDVDGDIRNRGIYYDRLNSDGYNGSPTAPKFLASLGAGSTALGTEWRSIGYMGFTDRMIIDFSGWTQKGTFSGWDTFNGEKWNVSGGGDVWKTFNIPKGYLITGVTLNWENPPDEIVIRKGSRYNNTTNTLVYSTTNPCMDCTITFDTPVSSSHYLYVEFWNDGVNQFTLYGGEFWMSEP